jgi:putative tryptophan/tyrosine transport system substrate-binding protein
MTPTREIAGAASLRNCQSLEVRSAADFDTAFQAALKGRAEAIIVVSSRQTALNRARILEFAIGHKLPLVGGWGPWAQGGALLSYGPNLDPLVRLAATYVDKILKGAKPADLPVEHPTKFELVINLKTAKALGLTIPQTLLLRADQVIE